MANYVGFPGGLAGLIDVDGEIVSTADVVGGDWGGIVLSKE